MADIVTPLLNAQRRDEEVRAGFEDRMQAAFDFVNPRRFDMSGSSTKGSKRKTKMYDGVAQDAMLTWVDGMLGWVVSKPLTWQKATILDRRYRDDDGVKRYFDDYTEQMRLEFIRATFYSVEPEWLQDAASGGHGTILTEESSDLSHAICRVVHPGRHWIEENSEGVVDVFHERLTLTARQCLQKYNKPGDTLPAVIRKWAKDSNSSNWEVSLLQCVRPANDSIFESRIAWSKFAIVTIVDSLSGGHGGTAAEAEFKSTRDRLIRVQPLDYFSPTVWRFRKNSDELYGYSPAMDVGCVIDAVQQHAFNLLDMGNFAARPIMAVPDEKRTSFRRLPGATFGFGSEKRLPQAVLMGGEYPIAVDRENKLHALIYSRYGYDLWRMMAVYQQKKERNQAFEVSEARIDQARLLVGQASNFWDNGMVPVYSNIAKIAAKAGRLPEPPAILQDLAGSDVVEVVPLGPLSQLQEYASNVSGIQQGMRFLSDIAEIVGRHISPQMAAQLYHRINLPDLAEFGLDKTGMPRRLMRTDEEVAALVADDHRRMAQQEAAVNAQKMAAASAQLGKPVAENSLLAAGVA
jgi:hypothetical protein